MRTISSRLTVSLVAVAIGTSTIEVQAQATQPIVVRLVSDHGTVQLTRPQLVARTSIVGDTGEDYRVCGMPSPDAALQSFVARFPTPEQASPEIQRTQQWRDAVTSSSAYTSMQTLLLSQIFNIPGAQRPSQFRGFSVYIADSQPSSASLWEALDRGETVNRTLRSACLRYPGVRGWVQQALSVLRQYYGLPAQ